MNKLSPKLITKTLMGGTLIGLALASQPAQAILVNVNGNPYEVTTFTGSYNNNISKFDTPANGGQMPWFGDRTLAAQFALAVYGLTPPNGGFTGSFTYLGPFFATFIVPDENGNASTIAITGVSLDQNLTNVPVGETVLWGVAPSGNFSYATAVAVPWETDALSVIGATTLFGFGVWTKRKRKVDLSK